jgi:hypothetical protein
MYLQLCSAFYFELIFFSLLILHLYFILCIYFRYNLSGPADITGDSIAADLSEVLKEKITYERAFTAGKSLSIFPHLHPPFFSLYFIFILFYFIFILFYFILFLFLFYFVDEYVAEFVKMGLTQDQAAPMASTMSEFQEKGILRLDVCFTSHQILDLCPPSTTFKQFIQEYYATNK